MYERPGFSAAGTSVLVTCFSLQELARTRVCKHALKHIRKHVRKHVRKRTLLHFRAIIKTRIRYSAYIIRFVSVNEYIYIYINMFLKCI